MGPGHSPQPARGRQRPGPIFFQEAATNGRSLTVEHLALDQEEGVQFPPSVPTQPADVVQRQDIWLPSRP